MPRLWLEGVRSPDYAFSIALFVESVKRFLEDFQLFVVLTLEVS
jgi:hypothetical protein